MSASSLGLMILLIMDRGCRTRVVRGPSRRNHLGVLSLSILMKLKVGRETRLLVLRLVRFLIIGTLSWSLYISASKRNLAWHRLWNLLLSIFLSLSCFSPMYYCLVGIRSTSGDHWHMPNCGSYDRWQNQRILNWESGLCAISGSWVHERRIGDVDKFFTIFLLQG